MLHMKMIRKIISLFLALLPCFGAHLPAEAQTRGSDKLPRGFEDCNENQSKRAPVAVPPRARKKFWLEAMQRKE